MILNGWKEIATYLKGSVRGVQRWESSGLPVIRPTNGARGSVIAYSEQIDGWLRDTRSAGARRDLEDRLERSVDHATFQENLRRARQASDKLRATRLEMEAHMTSLQREVAALRAAVIRMKQQAAVPGPADFEWYGHSGFKTTPTGARRIH